MQTHIVFLITNSWDMAVCMMATVCHAKIPLAPVVGVYSLILVGKAENVCVEENR